MAPRDREAREQALSTLALMRREKLSLKDAAKRTDVSPRTVLQYVRDGLRRSGGNYYAKPSDRISRSLNFLTDEGIISIDVRGSSALPSQDWTKRKRLRYGSSRRGIGSFATL